MSALVPGRVYYGPGQQRLRLLRIEGKKAVCEWPMSHQIEVMTVTQLEKWAGASERRTYHHKNGEIRTKRSTDPDTGAVTYHTVAAKRGESAAFAEVKTVSAKVWAKWRKGVPG